MTNQAPEQHLAALPLRQQAAIARQLCTILEFGPPTEPAQRGQAWDSETLDHIARVFHHHGATFTSPDDEDHNHADCQLCGAPGGFPYCTGTFAGRVSCADVIAADTPAPRPQPAAADPATRLLHLRRPGGRLAAMSYGYDRFNHWHQWTSPSGAELRYRPADATTDIRTATGQTITLDPAAGMYFTLPEILRLLGALMIISPVTGGIRIEA